MIGYGSKGQVRFSWVFHHDYLYFIFQESLSLWKLGLEYFLLHDLDKAEALLEVSAVICCLDSTLHDVAMR